MTASSGRGYAGQMSIAREEAQRVESALRDAERPAGQLRTLRFTVEPRVDAEGNDALTITGVLPDDVSDEEIERGAPALKRWVRDQLAVREFAVAAYVRFQLDHEPEPEPVDGLPEAGGRAA